MSPGTKKQSLVAGEHGSGSDTGGASLSRLHADALASIKRELAAIVLFGGLFAWGVIAWFEGLEEAVLLGGYGVGAALWVRVRAGGLLRSWRSGDARGRDGAQQE